MEDNGVHHLGRAYCGEVFDYQSPPRGVIEVVVQAHCEGVGGEWPEDDPYLRAHEPLEGLAREVGEHPLVLRHQILQAKVDQEEDVGEEPGRYYLGSLPTALVLV